ncbi:MAG: hypothetical protein DWQ05_20120 [Calditrichaeota bacterium]|nr:MAG: hypothetical protein DWQ05_20120 [Calditrichota bacterium]
MAIVAWSCWFNSARFAIIISLLWHPVQADAVISMPSDPSAPSTPSIPSLPAGPCGPIGPSGPSGPFGPSQPANPMTSKTARATNQLSNTFFFELFLIRRTSVFNS